jgi:hypothetical protein
MFERLHPLHGYSMVYPLFAVLYTMYFMTNQVTENPESGANYQLLTLTNRAVFLSSANLDSVVATCPKYPPHLLLPVNLPLHISCTL